LALKDFLRNEEFVGNIDYFQSQRKASCQDLAADAESCRPHGGEQFPMELWLLGELLDRALQR
jgi:hypothetical protein